MKTWSCPPERDVIHNSKFDFQCEIKKSKKTIVKKTCCTLDMFIFKNKFNIFSRLKQYLKKKLKILRPHEQKKYEKKQKKLFFRTKNMITVF